MKKILIGLNKIIMGILIVLTMLVGITLDEPGFTTLKIEAVVVCLLAISSTIYHLTKTERRM